MTFALELLDITKRFGNQAALTEARLQVRPGTVHALLGENGAGKTTLMRLAFGLLRPDAGTMRVAGREVRFRSAVEALALGIGMVHQHFTLVPSMTVAENVALGNTGHLDPGAAVARVEELAARTGLSVSARARVEDLPVGAQQRAEILKALARDVRVLILDEPTAVLAPAEADELLSWVRAFARGDRAVVLITHKLREALSVADDVTVLRTGRTVLATSIALTSEPALVSAMLGGGLPAGTVAPRVTAPVREVALRLTAVDVPGARGMAVRGASFEVRRGEIVGVAAVEGAGHHELLRALAGIVAPTAGRAEVPADVAFIPEDRYRDAVILDFSLTENLALRGLGPRRGRMPWRDLRARALSLLDQFDVRAKSPDVPLRALSGGNQQKFVLARAFDPLPSVVIAENPTRGLDVKATRAVHHRLRAARDAGAAVVVYSSDADEVLLLADRVVVVHNGRLIDVPPDREAVGRAMLGAMS